jgi:hypothetical protein
MLKIDVVSDVKPVPMFEFILVVVVVGPEDKTTELLFLLLDDDRDLTLRDCASARG